LLALAACAASLIYATVASATAGTWVQYPSGATEYQAEVQQPINTANTSNWSSKSKGGIPVMFKLSSRPGPAVFESIGSDVNTANDFAYVSFRPSEALTFADLTTLKTDYTFTLGDCHGGALRWSVRIDGNDNGVNDGAPTDPAVFIYYGKVPQFGNGDVNGCTPTSVDGEDGSGVNMLASPGPRDDVRFDTGQFAGGTFYDSYANAVAFAGTHQVLNASLVLDGGWKGDQRATVSNTIVNGNEYDFVTNASAPFAPTCDLPAATIAVGKGDPVADGDVNEAAVQGSLADSGNAFRVVDCKYQYVLSIPSLQGAGTYEVQIKIGGVRVPTPASPNGKVKFDLK
jgi:hypothetical protein